MAFFSFDQPVAEAPVGLGPAGPFPRAPLVDTLDRRWLHYAFLSTDGQQSMVANAAWLGPAGGADRTERFTTILLLKRRGQPWESSQFNAVIDQPPWSAFALPHRHGAVRPLTIRSTDRTGGPAVDLTLTRTSRPCSSQCAFFAGHQHLRWQSEVGVRGQGRFQTAQGSQTVDLIGYHERVRGRWSWPDLGEWVFGFANDLADAPDRPPAWAAVFTFIRPSGRADDTTASFMLWKCGRMVRHFPRRTVSMAVRGELDRAAVTVTPPLAQLLGEPPMAPVPKRLAISAVQGDDWAALDFQSEAAARVVIPNEIGVAAFSVHEVVGDCLLTGSLNGQTFEVKTRGIVEFSGGAGGD